MKPEFLPPLIDHLARLDELFAPIRSPWNSDRVVALLEQRENYSRYGLPIVSTGKTAAEWKTWERRLDALEASGLVTCSCRAGKRVGMKLADTTDWYLRRAATLADWPDVLTLMAAVGAQQEAGFSNAGIVPEWSLACGVPHGDDYSERERGLIIHQQFVATAGLVRGWLRSWSDGDGAHGYHLSEAGRDVLNSPVAPNVEWPEYSSEMFATYDASRDSACEQLKAVKPSHPNCVAIPLSCGMWPEDSEAAPIPALFTRAGTLRSFAAMRRAIEKAGARP